MPWSQAQLESAQRLGKEDEVTEPGAEQGPPPRQVEPRTRVVGHVVVSGPRRTFCSCGWSTTHEAAANAVTQHLRTAWPILVAKDDGETVADWRERLVAAHAEALETRELLWQQHRMGDPIQSGHPFPLIPEDWAEADERVQVLEHQLAEMPAHEF